MKSVIPAKAGIQQRRRHVRRSLWRTRLDPRLRGGDNLPGLRGRHERASLQGSRHRRRPRRLCRRDPCGPARPRHDPRGSRPSRRNVPQRRLHSLEGADPRRRGGAWPARAPRARRHRALDRVAHARFRAHDRLEGFDRHEAHQRRRRSSEEGQGAHASRNGDDRRWQDGDRQRRHRREPRHRRASRPCDRLGAGGIADAQVRWRCPVFDRRAGAD